MLKICHYPISSQKFKNLNSPVGYDKNNMVCRPAASNTDTRRLPALPPADDCSPAGYLLLISQCRLVQAHHRIRLRLSRVAIPIPKFGRIKMCSFEDKKKGIYKTRK